MYLFDNTLSHIENELCRIHHVVLLEICCLFLRRVASAFSAHLALFIASFHKVSSHNRITVSFFLIPDFKQRHFS